MARTYHTNQGDTWDLIAYQQLGSEKYMKELIEANLPLSDVLRFDVNTEIIIPDLQVDTSGETPFWKSDDDNSIWAEEVF